jgi:hypothetical protein
MLSGVRSRNAAPARGMLGRRSGCVINGPPTIHLFAANADWSKATLPKGSFRDSMELLQHAPPIRRSPRDIMLRLRGGLRGQRMIQRILLSVAAALATVAMVGTAASAHPHVWVTIKSELVYTPDGSVTGVRQAWTFDDMFSAFALQGIEAKKKGEFAREELAPLAEVNVSSLKEYEYFTYDKGLVINFTAARAFPAGVLGQLHLPSIERSYRHFLSRFCQTDCHIVGRWL